MANFSVCVSYIDASLIPLFSVDCASGFYKARDKFVTLVVMGGTLEDDALDKVPTDCRGLVSGRAVVHGTLTCVWRSLEPSPFLAVSRVDYSDEAWDNWRDQRWLFPDFLPSEPIVAKCSLPRLVPRLLRLAIHPVLGSKPNPVPSSKPDPVPSSKPDPVPSSKPDPVLSSKPDPVLSSKPEPKPLPKLSLKSLLGPELKPELKFESEKPSEESSPKKKRKPRKPPRRKTEDEKLLLRQNRHLNKALKELCAL